MKITTDVKVRRNHIAKRIKGVQVATADATWRAATLMRNEMRNRVRTVHSKPGEVAVADSVTIVGQQGDATVKVGSVGAHRNRPVALFLEFGTVRQRAQPFIRPASARGRKFLKQETEDAIRRDVNSDG